MNRRIKRMMVREYKKNKAKLIHNLKELNIPTEQEVEEYIMSKTNQSNISQPNIIQPLTIINDNDNIKEYYNTK